MIGNNSQILPLSLDGKQHTNRSLGYFVNELQLGSILHGSVSSAIQNGNALISTIYGKFSIQNLLGLKKGDKITFTISADGDNLFANITFINDIANRTTKPIEMQIITKNSHDTTPITEDISIKIDINQQAHTQAMQSMKATVSYLNLSKIDTNSIIYKILSSSSTIETITLKIIKGDSNITLLPHQIIGEVIEDNNDNSKQLIKTNFGILSVNNAQIHIGKKLILEIQLVNNSSIYNTLNMLNINDFLFKLYDNWSALKQLLDSFIKFRPKDHEITEYSKGKDNYKGLLKTFSDRQINKQEIRILSENLNKLKKLYMLPHINIDNENNWYSFFIPVFDGEKIIDHKIYIQRAEDKILRFIIEINLAKIGEIQIDGYVKLNFVTIAESLDLIVRFKDLFNKELQDKISEIFALYQNVSGLRGNLSFQQVQDFTDFNKT